MRRNTQGSSRLKSQFFLRPEIQQRFSSKTSKLFQLGIEAQGRLTTIEERNRLFASRQVFDPNLHGTLSPDSFTRTSESILIKSDCLSIHQDFLSLRRHLA